MRALAAALSLALSGASLLFGAEPSSPAPGSPATASPSAPAAPAAATAPGVNSPAASAPAVEFPVPGVPVPGDPDFIGPLAPPKAGDPDFIGPPEPPKPPKPGDPDFVGPLDFVPPKEGEADFVGPLPNPDRITFDFKVAPEKGGGTITGGADTVESLSEDEVVAVGNVEIHFKDMKIRADQIVLHRLTSEAEAIGRVIVDQGPQMLTGERADFDLEEETGEVFAAHGSFEPDMEVSGKRIAKIGENVYDVEDGTFTSCTGDRTPDWSFHIAKARINLGDYAYLHSVTMRVKKLPFLYVPYLVWPAKLERSSGLLVPKIGYSARHGGYFGLEYFQTFGPSYDTTVLLDGYSQGFYGLGDEFRWAPSEDSKGMVQGYFLKDNVDRTTEYKWHITHDTENLFGSMKAVVDWSHFSNYAFFRNFLHGEFDVTRPYVDSNAFVAGSYGPQSFTLLLNDRESYSLDVRTGAQTKLPELAYRVSKLKLWSTPLYFSFDSRFSQLDTNLVGIVHEKYGRADVQPALTLPIGSIPWLSIAATIKADAAWYGNSVPRFELDPTTGSLVALCGSKPVDLSTKFCNESLRRFYPTSDLEIVGPSFSRIYDFSLGSFQKFKHIIEPRFSYVYVGKFDDALSTPIFDEVDGYVYQKAVQYSIANRVLGKPRDPEEGGAFEIFNFVLSQALSLDKTMPLQTSSDASRTSQKSGVTASLRLNLSKEFSVQAQALYGTLFKGLSSTSFSGIFKSKYTSFNLTWYTRTNLEQDLKTQNTARLATELQVWPKRLTIGAQVSYDVLHKLLQQQSYLITYNSQCWSFILELRDFNYFPSYRDRYYAFTLSLKNVGDFLDFSGGSRTVY